MFLLSGIKENLIQNLLNPSIKKVNFTFHTRYFDRLHLESSAELSKLNMFFMRLFS